MMIRSLIIRGRVQGVGYRYWMKSQADTLGVSGWTRNHHDGAVHALVSGAPDRVAQLIDRCRSGPTFARVDDIQVDEVDDSSSDASASFVILRG